MASTITKERSTRPTVLGMVMASLISALKTNDTRASSCRASDSRVAHQPEMLFGTLRRREIEAAGRIARAHSSYEPGATVQMRLRRSSVHTERLETHPAACARSKHCAPTRTTVFGWIESAKRDETKARRVNEAIRLLTAGKTLGLK